MYSFKVTAALTVCGRVRPLVHLNICAGKLHKALSVQLLYFTFVQGKGNYFGNNLLMTNNLFSLLNCPQGRMAFTVSCSVVCDVCQSSMLHCNRSSSDAHIN